MRPPSWTANPSQFTREQANEWRRWNADDNASTPHRDVGSRSRPVSIGRLGSTDEELYELMVKRGLVAGPAKKRRRK
jgi:hypothetical protein